MSDFVHIQDSRSYTWA